MVIKLFIISNISIAVLSLKKFVGKTIPLFLIFILLTSYQSIKAQSTEPCPSISNKKADKLYDKAIKAFQQRNNSECIRYLNEVIDMEPNFVDAYFVRGLIYIEKARPNLKAAKSSFENVIEICPSYDIYAYFYLAQIAYGSEDYSNSAKYINNFLEDVDLIKSDADYNEAVSILEYSNFFNQLMNNPVPFNPRPVPGISTALDEYLPIISPDRDLAMYTRRIKIPPRRDDLTPRVKYKEKFMFSKRSGNDFSEGQEMPPPFNKNDNEGGATLTIDNKTLYYTLCKFAQGKKYYNCDICFSENIYGTWTEIQNISEKVNHPDAWDSQPTITSDGKSIFFVSDRDGGYGGYDLYKTQKDDKGEWAAPENLGPTINTPGNEKSPFIHTDSQTLYFSSDGFMTMGGYDIFFSKLDSTGNWKQPRNIGYPINSYDDDIGFFASTDGRFGFFASNKYDGKGGWDVYYFDLYEEARPEKVLFIKGSVVATGDQNFKNMRIELKNVGNQEITDIEVDTITGEYVAALPFRDDYILTVKSKGFVQETNYLSHIDPRYKAIVDLIVNLKPIEVGMSYNLNDIYFDFNSADLRPESKIVISEFNNFLMENPNIKVSIQGHTDNIGNDQANLILSESRAKSVYQHLLSSGTPANRINYKGFGESKPVVSNDTENGRSRNRRTEFVIIEK